jgi:TolB-like protein/DNA-binding winged helix-turn-helix (wHTH) protein
MTEFTSEQAPSIDLAHEADFLLGPALVRPAAFEVEAGGVRTRLQRRVMQVLVALARANGELVSRDALVESCWGGTVVSEDAINRCIQRLRRLAEAEAPGAFSIETLLRAGYRLTPGKPPEPAPATPVVNGGVTLAVLPFVNMSSDADQEYFSDGLSEELLNQLAQIKRLKVPARTSCFAFKGRNLDIKLVGEMLGVGHVLEGSVRRAGDRLRITAQLIECGTGYHLWSEAFDRRLDDVFAIQEDVARAVTRELGVTLGFGESVRAPGGTEDREAYDRYLRARALYHQQGADGLRRSIEIFREAVSLDPGFVLAWRGLFAAHVDALLYLAESSEEAFKGMAEAGGRILALAPDAWWSHALRAALASHQHNWVQAEQDAKAAYDAAPAVEVEAAFAYGSLLASLGRVKEGLDYVLKLRLADPLSLRVSAFMQALYDFAGRPEDAEAEYRRSLDLAGAREVSELLGLLRALSRGDAALAGARARRLIEVESVSIPTLKDLPEIFDKPKVVIGRLQEAIADPACQDSTRRLKIALLAAQYGDDELAMRALHRSAVDFEGGRIYAIWHPALAGARRSQAFKDMLSELRLVDYWRTTGNWGDFARPAGADGFDCG